MIQEPSTTDETPRYRPTARVLVLDPLDRLLLLLAEDPTLSIPRLWITPGGGVEPGESFEEGARRELWEETGITAPLGPCVWTRRIVHRWAEGLLDIDERYFVVRVDSIEINAGKLTDWERTVLTEHRWFTVDDIARCEDVVAPRCLATILPELLAGPYPTEPVTIGR